MLYAYPRFSNFDLGIVRFLGPGLGNLLLPWARCVVACRRHPLVPLAPTWPQIKIGPWLRREPDKRIYAGLFRRRPGEIYGLHKLRLLLVSKRVPETRLTRFSDIARKKPIIVEFSGMDGLFTSLLGEHQFVREELRAMTRPAIVNAAEQISPLIGIHVRLGDFTSPKSDQEIRSGNWSTRLPIDWYVQALQAVRLAAGRPLEALVFSDGSAEELRPLLAIQGVVRVTAGSSIADLFAISRSKILIASGSTFSMWASYLGRMPVLWYPGQLRQRLYPATPDLEVEYNRYEYLPNGFVESVKRIAGAGI